MSVRCQAERERRMALEALVGGKRPCPFSCLHLDFLPLTLILLLQTSLTGTAT
jgi:hypothetical protein